VISIHDIREHMADGAWKYDALALRGKGSTINVNEVLIASSDPALGRKS